MMGSDTEGKKCLPPNKRIGQSRASINSAQLLPRKKFIPASDPKQCVGGHQQRILYVSLPIRAAATNRMKIVYKTYVCVFCTIRISRSSAGAMSPIHALASTNMDPLQDPHLRIHVSASLCLRLLCKIHVSGFMSQHPCVSQGPLQDPCLRIHISAAICISGSSTRSTSSDSCLRISVSQDPLQDPCLRIHVSASLYLRILCKIHVSGSMCPIHVLASTNMDPLQDPCLRIHVSASICISGSAARSTSSDSCPSIFVSQAPLQDPCLRIHVSAFIRVSGSSARSMSPIYVSATLYLKVLCKIHVSGLTVSASLYLTILCKIHVSGSMSQHTYVSQDPLHNPCLRIHESDSCLSTRQNGSSSRSMSPGSCLSIFASQDPLQDPCLRIHVSASLYLRILYKIHVSGSRSQQPYVSQDPLHDLRLRIHVSASLYLRILCKIHVSGSVSRHPFLRILCKIHVAGFMSQHPCVSQDPLQDPCLRIRI